MSKIYPEKWSVFHSLIMLIIFLCAILELSSDLNSHVNKLLIIVNAYKKHIQIILGYEIYNMLSYLQLSKIDKITMHANYFCTVRSKKTCKNS